MMDFFTKISVLDIKKYNYWVNFEVLPQLVLDYNEGRKSIDEFKNFANYSNGSKEYNKLRKQLKIKDNFSSNSPNQILILVSTPSNNQICEVALAFIAINTTLRNAVLITLEYTFDSSFAICEPTTTGHGNYGINPENPEQFAVYAYNIAMKRWNEISESYKPKLDKNTPLNEPLHSTDILGEMLSQNIESEQKNETIPNDEIRQFWPLLDFAREHGRMSVLPLVDKDGRRFKACKFLDKEGNKLYVDFSSTLGELSASEISTRKNDLFVVLKTSGEYLLCASEEVSIEDSDD